MTIIIDETAMGVILCVMFYIFVLEPILLFLCIKTNHNGYGL